MTSTTKQPNKTKRIKNSKNTKKIKNTKEINANDLNTLEELNNRERVTNSPLNSAVLSIQAQNKPCYIPLNLTSQCGHELVLYYNGNAPHEAIFDCATARIETAIHLLESFHALKTGNPETLQSVAAASSLLLNDALTLLHELNPKASNLKQ